MNITEILDPIRNLQLNHKLKDRVYGVDSSDKISLTVADVMSNLASSELAFPTIGRLVMYTKILFSLDTMRGVVFSGSEYYPNVIIPYLLEGENRLPTEQRIVYEYNKGVSLFRADNYLASIGESKDGVRFVKSRRLDVENTYDWLRIKRGIRKDITQTPVTGTKYFQPYIAAAVIFNKI